MVAVADKVALDRLRELLAAVLDIDIEDVRPAASFHADLEIDSLQKIEFLGQIEREFGVSLAPEDVAELQSLVEVLALLHTLGVVRNGG